MPGRSYKLSGTFPEQRPLLDDIWFCRCRFLIQYLAGNHLLHCCRGKLVTHQAIFNKNKLLLISAANAVLEQTHFNALTVKMVTRGTSMARSAFYHYLSSLEELAIDLFE